LRVTGICLSEIDYSLIQRVGRHQRPPQSARGLAHSKTLRELRQSFFGAQRLGLRRPSAAFPTPGQTQPFL